MSKITPVARKTEIVVQELDKELLIYDLRANKALSLNETSALIWQLSNGDKTVSQIAEAVTQKLNVAVKEEFVWLALEQLKKEKLLENEAEIPGDYQGATRREVIRKIGFASLVTLPIITSLIAPTALQAQSGNNCSTNPLPNGCPCSSGVIPCTSGCCGSISQTTAICVAFQAAAPGSFCRSLCQCSGGCCGFGAPNSPVCVQCGTVTPGNRCRTNQECVSNNCSATPIGGVCA